MKAFFTVHLVVALFAAAGLHLLTSGELLRAWRRLAAAAPPIGLLLMALPLLPTLAPEATRLVISGLFPPDAPWPWRASRAAALLLDAAVGGGVSLAIGLVAVTVTRRRVPPGLGACLVAGLLTADLLRTGAGLNPMVTPSFFEPSEAMAPIVARLRSEGARVYTCYPFSSPSFRVAQQESVLASEPYEARIFALLTDSLTPFHNMSLGVPAVLGIDRTMLVPTSRVFTPEEAACEATPRLLQRVRLAGATHLLRLDPLEHPELRLQESVSPPRIAPLRIYVYALARPLPRTEVARRAVPVATLAAAVTIAGPPGFQESGSVAIETGGTTAEDHAEGRVLSLREGPGWIEGVVETDRSTVLVVREAWAPGWSASVNGARSDALRANGRHLAAPLAPGRNEVRFDYRPPRRGLGIGLTLLSALIAIGLAIRRRSASAA